MMSQSEPFQRVEQRLRELLGDFGLSSVIRCMLREFQLSDCILKVPIVLLQLIDLNLQ